MKQPRTKPKSRPPRVSQAAPEAAAEPPGRARRWWFRAAALLLPLLALVGLEATLRLGGYGYSTGFFNQQRINGQDFLVENDAFGFRFFPRDLARMPLSLRMPLKKAPGTYRIFILGESAAMGDPEPAFGAGRYLEALLRERFPQTYFEVVNTAMTAINSHAILPIARDCARREGDLWILYLGNNEMVGPFGAATVFGMKAPPRSLVRGYLACQQLRSGQLLLALGRKLHRDAGADSWGGMDMFLGNQIAPGAPGREAVYRNFCGNLQDIVRTGLDSGAAVLLSTVAVNLKDCPPFASARSASATPADLAAAEAGYRDGCRAEQQTNYVEAARQFERAASLAPRRAEVQYRWGLVAMKSGKLDTARECFQRACDDDALPFRATSRINEIIRQVGAQFAGRRLDCCEVLPVLRTNSPEGICGREIFYEHVHLNFAGNYRLARAWAVQLEKFLPAPVRSEARSDWASQERCEQRLGLTEWDRSHVNAEMSRRRQQPPFKDQPNNFRALEELSDQAAELKQAMALPAIRSRAKDTYTEALRRAPEDYSVRENYAEFLEATGELKSAIEQWERVRELIPQDHAPYYQLGRLAAAQGQLPQARQWFAETVAMRPSFAPGWFELGSVHAAGSNYDLAVTAFERAIHFAPGNSQYWFYDGLALAMAGRRAEAITRYREAARLDPGDWKAHFELGGLLGQDRDFLEAKAESEAAVRLNPAFPTSHLNLGLALVQLGKLDEAEREFEETLRLQPANSRAADYLRQVRALKKGKRN